MVIVCIIMFQFSIFTIFPVDYINLGSFTKSFLSSLACCPTKPAALVKSYSSKYSPVLPSSDLPLCLSELFKSKYLEFNYGELAQRASKCVINVTPEEVKVVEEQTRSQSNSTLWYKMNTGRITAQCIIHLNPFGITQ